MKLGMNVRVFILQRLLGLGIPQKTYRENYLMCNFHYALSVKRWATGRLSQKKKGFGPYEKGYNPNPIGVITLTPKIQGYNL